MNSLKILYESNTIFNWDNFNWSNYLDTLGKAVSRYNDMNTRGEADPAKFLREHLPAYWQSVRALNAHQWGDCLPSSSGYNVGIFLVGFSSLPIVLSIAEIQPCQKIYFIHSKDTEKKCDEIILRLTEMLVKPPHPFQPLIDLSGVESLIDLVKNADKHQITDASDPVSTFKQIKDIIDNVRENSEDDVKIALDLTGGKKTMIGGGYTAGSIYSISPECDMFYVDSREYKPDLGTPKPGTEFLSKLENPYDVYNLQTVSQAKELFEKHNYEAAAKLWERIDEKLQTSAKRYGLDNEHQEIEKNLYMADCYGLWDAFDYIAARNSKKDNGDIWDYNAKHTLPAAGIDILGILSEIRCPQTLFDEDARIIHYAVDRYQNGIRRMESDRFDDAIVRFTQVVEILCRYQVYRIETGGFLTDQNHNPVPKGCCLDEHWRISELIRFLFRKNWKYDHRYNIANQGMRLNINNYGYNNTDQIIDLIEARNDFVHVNSNPGWEEMQKDAENLQELAKTFLENFSSSYCCNNGLSFDELLELHKFRR